MRVLSLALPAAFLLGCAAGPQVDAREECISQGHAPGTDAFRACVDAGGAEIATGPGSPYANADEEEGGL